MRIDLKRTNAMLYIVMTLFMLAFINYDGATAFLPMTVPFINAHVVILHFVFAALICMILLLASVFDRKLKTDTVGICLFIKVLIDAVPFFRDDVDFGDYLWHWACTVVALISYLVIINSSFDKKNYDRVKRALYFFGLILSFQVFYTAIFGGFNYLDLKYKLSMVIPYGGSNIIASAILPIIFLSFYWIDSPIIKWLSICCMGIAVILTKSRGGMLYGTALLFFCIYKYNKRVKKNVLGNICLIMACILIGGALISDEGFTTLMQGYASANKNFSVSGITSGRTSLWGEMIKTMFDQNLLFGVGMKSLTGHSAGAHNIIIDVFYKGGIVGGINYLILLLTVVRASIKNIRFGLNDFAVMTLVSLGNMMFEVNYFTYGCDAFFWVFASMTMLENHELGKVTAVD